MDNVLSLGLQAMRNDMRQIDLISMNIANALTPGYKREISASRPLGGVTQGFSDAMLAQGLTQAQMVPASTLAERPSLLVRTDERPGSLKSTGQSLDLALAGSGYFEVMTPTGTAYTRQGAFQLDGRGRLVTAQGWPVMGRGGEIFLRGPSPWIDQNGSVYESRTAADPGAQASGGALAVSGISADAQSVAQIKVVQAGKAAEVRSLGDGLLEISGAVDIRQDSGTQIRQGFLENSNVSAMHEMVQLIQTMRHFESIQKVTLGYDDMTGQAIRKLGELG